MESLRPAPPACYARSTTVKHARPYMTNLNVQSNWKKADL